MSLMSRLHEAKAKMLDDQADPWKRVLERALPADLVCTSTVALLDILNFTATTGFALCRTADFEKPSRDGNYVLRAKRFGKFWAPERSIKITSGRYTYRSIEALVFAFGEIPIWTRTRQAAMRLAEHCDPIPASPVAGFWRPMFTAT
jgi:hypothetical protein